MADISLEQQDPFEGVTVRFSAPGIEVLPLEIGPILAVQPYDGKQDAAGAVLRETLGVGLAGPGRIAVSGGGEVIWWDRDGWLARATDKVLKDTASGLLPLAMCRRQQGAYAVLSVGGSAAADVLARLTPLDLRKMVAGRIARTDVSHMHGAVIKRESGFEVWVGRSFSRTLAHEVIVAANGVVARCTNV